MKDAVKVMEAREASALGELKLAQDELDKQQAVLDDLQRKYADAVANKGELQEAATVCRRKISLAISLVDGLADERVRWENELLDLGKSTGKLIGDVAQSTAFLSYLGPFNQEYRSQLLEEWQTSLTKMKIRNDSERSVISMLVNAHTLGMWQLEGLPGDALCSQNGIIVMKSDCYPLLIDPQGQGKRWIITRLRAEMAKHQAEQAAAAATAAAVAASNTSGAVLEGGPRAVRRASLSAAIARRGSRVGGVLGSAGALPQGGNAGAAAGTFAAGGPTGADGAVGGVDGSDGGAAAAPTVCTHLEITTMGSPNLRAVLERCLNNGWHLLIEDVGEEIDPLLTNVLSKNYIKAGRIRKVKVGDREVEVADGFRIIMATELPNPVYQPEVYARTAVVNFTVTKRGLEEQLLGRVILREKRMIEVERRALLASVTENQFRMKELEDSLLLRLSSTRGSLVDDDTIVAVLERTRVTAREVGEKLAHASRAERQLDNAREAYRAVAGRGSILYFLIADMAQISGVYLSSLAQFLALFDQALELAPPSTVLRDRIASVVDMLTWLTFRYVERGLYEKHKFLFALLMACHVDMYAERLSPVEFDFLVRGGSALDALAMRTGDDGRKLKKPAGAWMPEGTWLNV